LTFASVGKPFNDLAGMPHFPRDRGRSLRDDMYT